MCETIAFESLSDGLAGAIAAVVKALRMKRKLFEFMGETETSVNTTRRAESSANYQRPSGELTSVAGGGLNSNVDDGIGARVWFE